MTNHDILQELLKELTNLAFDIETINGHSRNVILFDDVEELILNKLEELEYE